MTTKTRARPLSAEDRRSAIVDAVIPLILEHGGDLTTRQIARAAGVAEGTLFRAFGDKDSIIDAAVDRFFDPVPLQRQAAAIDPGLPLLDTVEQVFGIMQARTTGIMNMLRALGPRRRPPRQGPGEELVALLETVLAPHRAELRVEIAEIAYYLRLLALASSIGPLTESHPLTVRRLADLVVGGISKD